MYADDPMILELVALLKAYDLRHVVIAPGSRHYPIVRTLEADDSFELYSVVDERSAGFFAIGLIRAVGKPVAVMSTSGTAAVNFSSAMAEAYYQGLPLLAITADRLPELLDQMEDQMVDQQRLFAGMTRFKAQLKPIKTATDKWHVNRVVNEALLALSRDGGGPVHINVPIGRHTGLKYSVSKLPDVRVIRHHSHSLGEIDWPNVASRLTGKRVMVLWGQGMPPDTALLAAFNAFAEHVNVVVLADHLSNFHHSRVMRRPFELLGSAHARSEAMRPDVVVSVGGTSFLLGQVKALVDRWEVEHWRVDPDGEIVDPFWRLTDVVQVTAREFFSRCALGSGALRVDSYVQSIQALADTLPAPSAPFGELSVIGQFVRALPGGSALHVANSAPIRMAHLFSLDSTIRVLGNRGVNGIDGSMSSAIGYAAASDELTFLVIGDLSFFYDLNSLWIRHTPGNLRVLLVNNGGGALMHAAPLNAAVARQGALHISAGHEASARGWVESLGLRYRPAPDETAFRAALRELVDPADEGAMVVEVFTEKTRDIEHLNRHYRAIASAGEGFSPYRRARRLAGRTLRRLGFGI